LTAPAQTMNPISQSEFDRGVAYVDHLKEAAKDYLSSSGYEFSSTDKVVDGMFKSKNFFGNK
jgi:hypothetical protein